MGRVTTFLAEVRERRFFRILVVYLAAGWFALEAMDQIVGQELLPPFWYRLVLIWYLVGIPACILLAWHHGEKGRQSAPISEVILLGLLAAVAVGLSLGPVMDHSAERLRLEAAGGELDLQRMAVLYFRDVSASGEQQYLADGLTEDLISELGEVRTLDVVSRNGVAEFRDRQIPRDSIARLLEVGTLVDGTIEQLGDRLRVSVQLVDGVSGAEFQRTGFELPAADLLVVRDSLVHETSLVLRAWLGEEIQVQRNRRETGSTPAWILYQRAERSRKDAEDLARRGEPGMEAAFERADELLSQAEVLDPAWADPVILRGAVAYRRSRVAHDAAGAVQWIDRGLEHANRALALSPGNARALELRGTLKYWHHILNVTSDPDEQGRLLSEARADLERAVQVDPTLASAHSVLSHLYYREDPASAVLAARRAYEEDAYLEAANEVLWRLSMGSYDLAQFAQARRWCDEGARRFAEDFRFTECRLWLMTSSAVEPDPERAWQLQADLTELAPEARRPYYEARGRLLVGGILARAGLPDSARAAWREARAQAGPQVDPTRELLTVEAYMRTLANDNDEAIRLLTNYAAVNPNYSFDHHWWWSSLRGHPDFRGLAAAGGADQH